MTLEVLAPAKLNLTLEVLERRGDGYHEIASIMQAVDIDDLVRVAEAPSITLEVGGRELAGVPLEGSRNLAFRAAVALQAAAGRPDLGARIELDKGIPAGLGLGGGSSDAAAVLRALNQLWGLEYELPNLESIASGVGSDVPFFLNGGTALVTGRGERVEPLPDYDVGEFTVFLSSIVIEDKTRRMYATLRPADFSSGERTEIAAESLRNGLPLLDSDMQNAFDSRIGEIAPPLARAMEACRTAGLAVLATGSGPGFFSPSPFADIPTLLLRELDREWGVRTLACHSLSRHEALAIREI